MKRWFLLLIGCLAFVSIGDAANAQFSGARSTAELQNGCVDGNAADCDLAGLDYFDGKVVPLDYKRANTLFQRACDRGNPDGCYDLGWSHLNGFGLRKNPGEAVSFFQRACDGGQPHGCGQLAYSYATADGIKGDGAKAAIYGERACNAKVSMGCYVLAGAYLDGVPGYPKDVNRAVTLLRQACGAPRPFSSACARLKALGYPLYVPPPRLAQVPAAPPPPVYVPPVARAPSAPRPAQVQQVSAARIRPPGPEEARLTALCESSNWPACGPRAKLLSARVLANCEAGDRDSCFEYNSLVVSRTLPEERQYFRTARAMPAMQKLCATRPQYAKYETYCGGAVLIEERVTTLADQQSSDPAARSCIGSGNYVKVKRGAYKIVNPDGTTEENSDGSPKLYEESAVTYNMRQGISDAFNSPGLFNKCNRDVSIEVRYQTKSLPHEKLVMKANERDVHTTYRNPIVINARFVK